MTEEVELWRPEVSPALERILNEPWRRNRTGVTLKPLAEAPPTYIQKGEESKDASIS